MNRTDGVPREDVEAFCHRWHITELSVFGSVLRDDFSADSDVDVIVDVEPDHVPGFAFARLCGELEAILGRPVDGLTRAGIESGKETPIRRRIARAAQVYYGHPR